LASVLGFVLSVLIVTCIHFYCFGGGRKWRSRTETRTSENPTPQSQTRMQQSTDPSEYYQWNPKRSAGPNPNGLVFDDTRAAYVNPQYTVEPLRM
jgi:hypothetical protein